MRIFKVVLLVAVMLAVIFFSIGLIIPVFEYGNSITINSSRENVWSVYTNRKKEWIDGFESQKLVSGNPLALGSDYETTIVSGEEMVMHEKIVSIQAGKNIAWMLDNDVLISNYSYEFKGDSTRTEVTTHYQITGKNAFMKSVLYLSKPYLKNADAEMLTGLKKIAERQK